MAADTRNLSIGILLSLCVVVTASVSARLWQDYQKEAPTYIADSIE